MQVDLQSMKPEFDVHEISPALSYDEKRLVSSIEVEIDRIKLHKITAVRMCQRREISSMYFTYDKTDSVRLILYRVPMLDENLNRQRIEFKFGNKDLTRKVSK